MVQTAGLAEEPGRQVGQMSPRAWLSACLLAAFFGGIAGWSARVVTVDHRYIRSLAERHKAEATYINTRTDQLIRANEPKGETR